MEADWEVGGGTLFEGQGALFKVGLCFEKLVIKSAKKSDGIKKGQP